MIWQVREAIDSKKLPQNKCRYWPEIHVVKRNGDMGKMVQVKPKNVKKYMSKRQREKLIFYEDELDILRHKIVGPFGFQPPSDKNRAHTVAERYWDQLVVLGPLFGVDVSTVTSVVPLHYRR